MVFHCLNPLSKHYYRNYRSTDIEDREIITYHIEILISKISNPQTISNLRVSNSMKNSTRAVLQPEKLLRKPYNASIEVTVQASVASYIVSFSITLFKYASIWFRIFIIYTDGYYFVISKFMACLGPYPFLSVWSHNRLLWLIHWEDMRSCVGK